MALSIPLEATVQAVQRGLIQAIISHTAISLLDLPDAWLLLLAPRLTPDACFSTFLTCKAMRDLMLSQRRRVRTQFCLPLATAAATASAQKTLQRACQQCQAVTLVCHGPLNPVALHNAPSTETLLTCTMASLGQPLLVITSVELRGLTLDGLVPAWLRHACPNMTSLTLVDCEYILPDPTTSMPAATQLQELCLVRPSQLSSTSQSTQVDWNHHLLGLSGLQRLSVERSMQLLEACSALGTQVTWLSCCPPDSDPRMPIQLPAWFPNISELTFSGQRFNDHHIELLLRLPSLRRVWVIRTQLENSYADRPCAWTEVHFQEIHIDQLARWPLGGKPSLYCEPPGADKKLLVFPGQDLQATNRAVAAITACGGIRWGAVEHVMLSAATTEACLAGCLSILSGCHASHWTVMDAHMTPSLLDNLQPLLASLSVTHVAFKDCTWEHPGVCALILPSLPAHIQTVCFILSLGWWEGDMGKAQLTNLTQICVHADRAVIVRVLGGTMWQWREGWQQDIKAAMRAAGHEHVTLM